jgi:hypothetical protein
LGIRATARVFEVEPKTVLHWLVEAAEHLRAFSASCLCEVHVRQVHLDELYAVLRAVKAGERSEDEAIQRLERSPYWVWTAMDPERKRLVVIDVGTRSLAMAQRVVHHLGPLLAPDCVPLFLTDGFRAYRTALLAHVGAWRDNLRGARPKAPDPNRVGCRSPRCAMPRWASPPGDGAWWASSTAWCAAPSWRSRRS